MLWRLNELTLLAAVLAGLLIAAEVGFGLGRRHTDRDDEPAKTHIDSMTVGVLGLLALLLEFTYFMASSRFEARKTLVLVEANAIGTAYLRSQLLPPEKRSTVKQLLQAQVSARLAFHAAGVDPVRIEAANNEAGRFERRPWTKATDAAAQDPRSVPSGLYLESLNAVIDLHEKRQVAFESRVPEAELFFLLVVFVLVSIRDLDRPRRGFITVPHESLLRLQTMLERDAE